MNATSNRCSLRKYSWGSRFLVKKSFTGATKIIKKKPHVIPVLPVYNKNNKTEYYLCKIIIKRILWQRLNGAWEFSKGGHVVLINTYRLKKKKKRLISVNLYRTRLWKFKRRIQKSQFLLISFCPVTRQKYIIWTLHISRLKYKILSVDALFLGQSEDIPLNVVLHFFLQMEVKIPKYYP